MSELEVVVAEHDRCALELWEQRVNASQWINHPDYNSKTKDNDFAIIKLASPVSFSDYVVPACLPSTSANYDNVAAKATGWGKLSSGGEQPCVLQKVGECPASNY